MNVNVSYNGFSLADAASCVMMRLPVPDLVWDMDTLWKVWNEPLPTVDVPEVLPEPLPEVPAAKPEKGFRRKPITYAGKEYPSVSALAEAYGLTLKNCSARLARGRPLENKVTSHSKEGAPRKPVEYKGKTYASMAELAAAFSLNVKTCASRMKKGQPLEPKVLPMPPNHCKPTTYDGREYPSVKALADAYGLDVRLCRRRLQLGVPLDRCAGTGKPITISGKDYPSLKAAAEALGISYVALWTRMRKGQPLDMEKGAKPKSAKPARTAPEAPAASAPKPAVKPVTINGKEYRSLHEADEAERRLKSEPKPSPLGTLTMGGAPKSRPVTYNGREYPSMKALAREYNRNVSYCYDHIREGVPLVKKEEKPEAEADEFSLREIRATPAEEMKAWGKKWKACRLGGKKYTSLNALADLADVTLGQAYVGVEKMGKWIAEDEI